MSVDPMKSQPVLKIEGELADLIQSSSGNENSKVNTARQVQKSKTTVKDSINNLELGGKHIKPKRKVTTVIRQRKHRDGSVSTISCTRLPGIKMTEARESFMSLISDNNKCLSQKPSFEALIGHLTSRSNVLQTTRRTHRSKQKEVNSRSPPHNLT